MANSNITVSIDSDIYWIYKSTRIMTCHSFNCEHHMGNHRELGERWECSLKAVYMGEGGKCGYYKPIIVTDIQKEFDGFQAAREEFRQKFGI